MKKVHVHVESRQAESSKDGGHCFNTVPMQSQQERQGLEDPPILQKKRTYHKHNHKANQKRTVRKIGEDPINKVSLESVRKWGAQNNCATQCLRGISEIKILDVRYEVWTNCKSCDNRVTWILRQLQTFMEQNATTGWLHFKFRVDGTAICSTCYVHVLGYSRRQLERWKDDIRARNHKSACHGNALRPHETNHVASARAILQKYIKDCGCI